MNTVREAAQVANPRFAQANLPVHLLLMKDGRVRMCYCGGFSPNECERVAHTGTNAYSTRAITCSDFLELHTIVHKFLRLSGVGIRACTSVRALLLMAPIFRS